MQTCLSAKHHTTDNLPTNSADQDARTPALMLTICANFCVFKKITHRFQGDNGKLNLSYISYMHIKKLYHRPCCALLHLNSPIANGSSIQTQHCTGSTVNCGIYSTGSTLVGLPLRVLGAALGRCILTELLSFWNCIQTVRIWSKISS